MHKALLLSWAITYETLTPDGGYLHPRKCYGGTEQQNDMVSDWADGLVHKMCQNVSTGHCSIRAVVDFDGAKFEADVVRDIETMQHMLQNLPPARQLTYAEMRQLGYIGKWAGMTDEETEAARAELERAAVARYGPRQNDGPPRKTKNDL